MRATPWSFSSGRTAHFAARLPLLALDCDVEVTFLDSCEIRRMTGQELASTRLDVRLARQPDSALIVCRRC